jgi:hypothetical protein
MLKLRRSGAMPSHSDLSKLIKSRRRDGGHFIAHPFQRETMTARRDPPS